MFQQVGYCVAGEEPDSVSKTLEYAYDDFCAGVLARAAGRTNEAEAFMKSAMNYTNVWDAKTTFMRGRKADGSWLEPFDPIEWGQPLRGRQRLAMDLERHARCSRLD